MPRDQDAEESLQGTLVSAWREFSEVGRAALRTRLSKISTGRFVSMLRAERRRPRIAPSPPEPAPPTPAPAASPLREPPLPEPTGAGAAPPWLEPYPDHLLDHLADHATRPEARYDSTEAISLGFITALQLLPPRQRAALVLCDVVGYEAAEVADMLDTTRQAVDHALTHGRGVIDTRLADPAGTCIDSSRSGTGRTSRGDGGRRSARPPDATAEHPLAARFTHALEHADLDALIDLLHTDVKLSMPPAMLEYRGIESARRVFAGVTFRHGRTYRVVPTHANGQPAFGLYLADPHAGVHRAYALLVITTAGDLVTVVTAFTTAVMARFGLPRTLPGADWRIADTEP